MAFIVVAFLIIAVTLAAFFVVPTLRPATPKSRLRALAIGLGVLLLLAHVGATETCKVGKFAHVRSPYGCEELVGNVSEWCYPTEEKVPVGAFPPPGEVIPLPQPAGPTVYTVVRGACYLRTSATAMKSSHRRNLSVTRRNQWVGFRPACLLPVRPAA